MACIFLGDMDNPVGIITYFFVVGCFPDIGASIPAFTLSASINFILGMLKKRSEFPEIRVYGSETGPRSGGTCA